MQWLNTSGAQGVRVLRVAAKQAIYGEGEARLSLPVLFYRTGRRDHPPGVLRLYRQDQGWYHGAEHGTSHAQELSRCQGHDFDGGGWARIQAVRSQYRDTSTVPFLSGGGQSSGNMIQTTILTVDVAPETQVQ